MDIPIGMPKDVPKGVFGDVPMDADAPSRECLRILSIARSAAAYNRNHTSCRSKTGRHAKVTHMPMYEFSCQGCGAVFEELCARDAETCACPACGGQGTRMMSAATPKLRLGSPFTSTPRNAGAGAATGCGCASTAPVPAPGCACASGSAPKPDGCGNGGGCGCSG